MSKAKDFVEFIKLNNKTPSDRGITATEKSLGLWFRQYKGAINGKNRGKNYENVSNFLKSELGDEIFNPCGGVL